MRNLFTARRLMIACAALCSAAQTPARAGPSFAGAADPKAPPQTQAGLPAAATGVWMTTTFGAVKLGQFGGSFQDQINGRLIVTRVSQQHVVEGEWTQSKGSVRCSDGKYRGHYRIQFDQGWATFTGNWGYCDRGLQYLWTGKRAVWKRGGGDG